MHQHTSTFPQNLDLKSISDIQFYNGFVLTLQFRLRIGTFFIVHVGDSFDVVFRNQMDIPCNTSPDDIQKMMWTDKERRPREQFFTEALILDKNPPIDTGFHKRFIEFIENPENRDCPESNPRYFQAMTSLNDAIVGYHHATDSLFGGAVIERLTAPTFFARLQYLHTIACPSEYELSEAELVEILDSRSDRETISLGLFATHQLDDVPNTQLADIQRYVQLHQRFLFYQFVLDAQSKMIEQDFISAVLFAVVALESVHSTLLQMRLEHQMMDTVTDADTCAKKAETIANQLLLDIGLTKTIEMTSLLFLDAEDRLTQEDLQQCKLGITIRNDIMHALAKKGQYRLRNRTNKQISDAYSSVLKVVRHFAAIVERDSVTEDRA